MFFPCPFPALPQSLHERGVCVTSLLEGQATEFGMLPRMFIVPPESGYPGFGERMVLDDQVSWRLWGARWRCTLAVHADSTTPAALVALGPVVRKETGGGEVASQALHGGPVGQEAPKERPGMGFLPLLSTLSACCCAGSCAVVQAGQQGVSGVCGRQGDAGGNTGAPGMWWLWG